MSYTELKREAFEANMELNRRNLVVYTWGNVSQIDRSKGVIAIKPSGVAYEVMTPDDIVIVDLENKIVEGKMRPSSDTKTHTHLYRHFRFHRWCDSYALHLCDCLGTNPASDSLLRNNTRRLRLWRNPLHRGDDR